MKCGGNQLGLRTFIVRALSFSAVAALTLNPALSPVVAADSDARPVAVAAGGSVKTRFLSLGIGKSVIIDLSRDVKDVLVADPKIANAVVRSAQRAYIIGAAVGQTNVVFFDADGQQVAAYDIAVKRDLNGVRAALRQTLPGIEIEGVGDGVILTGSVSSPIEAQQAGDLAARLVGGADKVVNSIAVRGRDQVMLKVNVSEVRRDIVKQMGVDLSASMNYGTAVVNFNNSNPFTAYGRSLVSENGAQVVGIAKGLPTVQATVRAMESAGVMRTLAEPNLTAISGESATFIAGGEFPVPAGYSCDPTHACVYHLDQLQEIRHFPELHPRRAGRGAHQLARDDRGLRTVDRERHHFEPGWQFADRSLDSDPPCRDHIGDPVGWFHGDGRPDPGTDQTGRQRIARRRPIANSRRALQESGLRQQPDRTHGHGNALCCSRSRAEGTVPTR